MWHVSSRSGVATLRTAIHLLLTYLPSHSAPSPSRQLHDRTHHTKAVPVIRAYDSFGLGVRCFLSPPVGI